MIGIVALITALFPVAEGLSAGSRLEATLAGLTLPQWGAVAAAVANLLAPEATKEIEAHLSKADPHLSTFIEDIIKNGPDAAAKAAFQSWTSANADEAMKLQPGIGTDY